MEPNPRVLDAFTVNTSKSRVYVYFFSQLATLGSDP